jgi:hypothetical protein
MASAALVGACLPGQVLSCEECDSKNDHPRDERTRTYVARRTEEGKTKKEIIRCLKRYIAREIYRILDSLSLNKPPISVP